MSSNDPNAAHAALLSLTASMLPCVDHPSRFADERAEYFAAQAACVEHDRLATIALLGGYSRLTVDLLALREYALRHASANGYWRRVVVDVDERLARLPRAVVTNVYERVYGMSYPPKESV